MKTMMNKHMRKDGKDFVETVKADVKNGLGVYKDIDGQWIIGHISGYKLPYWYTTRKEAFQYREKFLTVYTKWATLEQDNYKEMLAVSEAIRPIVTELQGF